MVALKDWESTEPKMHREGIYVNIGINKLYYTRVLIDSGCSCYATVSERFANRSSLPRIPIRPRDLIGVNTITKNAITQVTYFDIDIDGHQQKRVFAYVLPDQTDNIILGTPWMVDQDVLLRPRKRRLYLLKSGAWVRQRDGPKPEPSHLPQINAYALQALVRRSRKDPQQQTTVFAASLADIEKALQRKVVPDPQLRLPSHYHEFLPLFDQQRADQLPPHREGIDHDLPITQIDGKEKELPWGPLYSMSREELIVLRKTLSELLDKGFIRASSSPASAPVLFVKKPGGGLRFCVDYRALNAITKKDRYPLPLIAETLRSLSKAKWLTKVDVTAAFHKIRIKEGEEWKTAFRTRYGLYEWLVTPFGLTGAPATFQRYVNKTLQEYLDDFCTAYIDDVLIYSDGSLTDHREKVKKVFKRLQDAGLQLDINKCEFEASSVKYLGYIVEAGKGIRVDPEKVVAIKEWETPRTVTQVRSFLGFANYYREFIPGFAHIANPLTDLTRKDTIFHWTDQCEFAFQALKDLLVNAPLLAHWDPDRETLVETDSSGYAVGGTLSQYDQEGKLRPVAFLSKKNLPAEMNYQIHDKEMLAIIKCLQQWRAELRSTKGFTILTDHKNLEYFMKKQNLTERQMRWANYLASFHFEIRYRPGKQNQQADALSRRDQDLPKTTKDERISERSQTIFKPTPTGSLRLDPWWHESTETLDLDEEVMIKSTWIAGGDADQEYDETPDRSDPPVNPFEDEDLKELWETALSTNNRYWLIRGTVARNERQFPTKWGLPISITECSVDDSKRLLWRDRIWVPLYEPLRTKIIQKTHDSYLAGHPGRDLTKTLISRTFAWPGLAQDVRRFIRNCDVCGRIAVWRERKRGLLKPLPIPDRPWQEISIDFITGVPPAGPEKATNIMVITERLQKHVIFQPMAEITTDAVAQTLLWCLIRHHGYPSAIVSDRGPQFTSQVWKRICELLQIVRRLSTAHHPETDGATERANQEVEHYLRAFTTYFQDNWDQLLPIAMLALNNRTATSTGLSPFFAAHGYHVDTISITEPLRESSESPIARGEAFVARLHEANEWAQASIGWAQEQQEYYANKGRQPADQFKAGDKVWLKLKNIKTDRPSRKLDWLNAKYEVIEPIGTHSYRLNTPPGIENVFHVSLIKRAADDPLPSQVQDDPQPPAIIAHDDHEEWEIDTILKAKKQGKGIRLLVKWKGYSKPTWEPYRNFTSTAALEAFEATHGPLIRPPNNSPPTPTTRTRRGRRGVL